jgi:hypothetical protein
MELTDIAPAAYIGAAIEARQPLLERDSLCSHEAGIEVARIEQLLDPAFLATVKPQVQKLLDRGVKEDRLALIVGPPWATFLLANLVPREPGDARTAEEY